MTKRKHIATRLLQGEELRRARDLYEARVPLRKIGQGLRRCERTVHDSLVAAGVNMRVRRTEGKKIKRCSRCTKEKPIADFHFNRSTRDGLAYQCRECSKRPSTPYQPLLRRVTNVHVQNEPEEPPERDSADAFLNSLIIQHTPFLLRPGPMRYVSIYGVVWRRG